MATWPAAISKTRLESLPLTDSRSAPGPLIVTLSVISNSLFSVMVPCSPGANAMVASPDWMPARSEQAPLSFRFVTMKVLSSLRSSITSRRGRTERRERLRLDPGRRDRVGEPVVNRRYQGVNNMMQAFLAENRSA